MITEKELENLIADPLIHKAAAHIRPAGVWTDIAEGRPERALAGWIAVLTRRYIREIRAASNPLVEKIWKFQGGVVDIDMRVGVHGTYRKLKIETALTGPHTLRFQVRDWHKKTGLFGPMDAEERWERYGVYRGNTEREGIETLPVR